MKKEIHCEITRIKELLDQTEAKLIEEVKKTSLVWTDQQAEALLSQLTECKDHIQQSLKVGTPHQLLTTKSRMTSHTENLIAIAQPKTFEPLERADIEFVKKNEPHDLS